MTASRRVVTIDCEYLAPQFAAAYLLIDTAPGGERRAAFIDNNTAHSVPLLLNALKQEGMTPEQVESVIITHVHLDHAGGTSRLMEACPRATLLAHPRAAKHMIDPSKLLASARQVYGDETFEKLYGRIDPIPASRVRVMEDGETVAFGAGAGDNQSSRAHLQFIHTRGHANHHLCIYEPETRSVFTGDSFGLAYPFLQRAGLFIFPSTSPTDFDYAEAVGSLDKIVATGARQAYLTHFGAITDFTSARAQLLRHLEYSQKLLERERAGLHDPAPNTRQIAEIAARIERELWSHLQTVTQAQGLSLTPEDRELMKLDLELNAQGLAHVACKTIRS
jgi:glyoxylase-like metal-dependent hydrolase (beta-lactamase superfamily II)